MSDSRLQDLLALSTVPRWSIVPTLRPQSVAEHSFRVAAIALEICRQINGEDLPAMVLVEQHALHWAIIHDGPEAETGDIPYPVKKHLDLRFMEQKLCPWYHPDKIHKAEAKIVKIADKVEEVLFIRQWGQGPKADAAMADAYNQVLAHTVQAMTLYGLPKLHRIVQAILEVPIPQQQSRPASAG